MVEQKLLNVGLVIMLGKTLKSLSRC